MTDATVPTPRPVPPIAAPSEPGRVQLDLRGIVKEFSGVRALDGVDLSVSGGEVLALVGENGAGKSTLINIVGGRWPHGTYEGSIELDGAPVSFSGPMDALARGIAVIHQELQLVPDLTVEENLFLGRLPAHRGILDKRAMHERARSVLDRYGFDLDPRATVRGLSVGRRQTLEIARALDRNARILVLDEPSSALTDTETQRLLDILRDLRRGGVATIYISHKLDEVFDIADRITVLRDGRTVGTIARADATPMAVVHMMVGRELGEVFQRTPVTPGLTRLQVRDLTVRSPIADRPLVDRLSFDVAAGEVLAIAGLLGSGRSETLLALFGALPRTGEVIADGRPIAAGRIDDAIDAGMALVTEDRKGTGLVLDFSCRDNISLANLDQVSRRGLVDGRRERNVAEAQVTSLGLRPPQIDRQARTFSGGNQQKIVLGKWLARHPGILLLDEPTRGVDVGAKAEIFAIIDGLRAQGAAIVMVSSDLREVIGVADRILVLHEGASEGELPGSGATQEQIMTLATRTAAPQAMAGPA